jgi:hypothetical protein
MLVRITSHGMRNAAKKLSPKRRHKKVQDDKRMRSPRLEENDQRAGVVTGTAFVDISSGRSQSSDLVLSASGSPVFCIIACTSLVCLE